MIRVWVRLLPYFIVEKIIKTTSDDITKWQGNTYRIYRIRRGEYLFFDVQKELYNKKIKLEKDLEKINKKLNEGETENDT